jgi:RND family efflux transporter MFP subunit
VLLAACHARDKEETDTEAAVPVQVAPARVGAIVGIVHATGMIAAASGAEQLVVAPQQARILELTKAVGDVVHRDEVLARFDAPGLQADAAGKAAGFAQAQARLDAARAAEQRTAALLQRGIAARKEEDEARKELQAAEAGLTQASAERDAASQIAARTTVRALFDGIVAQRTHNPGDLVEAGAEPILRVIDPSRLQIEASVAADDVARIHRGASARVALPGAEPIAARVESAPAAVRVETGTAPVRLSLAAGAHPAVGVAVGVEIDSDRHESAVLVPAAALVREEEQAQLFVVDAQRKAHRREVKTGLESAQDVEILSGVTAGEQVVVKGQQSLPDGASVQVGE